MLMSRSIITEHIIFCHVNRRAMEISIHMSGSVITEHLKFYHVNRRSMEISIHMFGSIITEHLTFYLVNRRSMEISKHMFGSIITENLTFCHVTGIYGNFYAHVWLTIAEHLTFYHVNRRSLEISMHTSGSIITEHLTFCHVTGRSTQIFHVLVWIKHDQASYIKSCTLLDICGSMEISWYVQIHLDLMNMSLEIKHWYLQKCSESILSMFGPKQLNTGMLHFVISVVINMSKN